MRKIFLFFIWREIYIKNISLFILAQRSQNEWSNIHIIERVEGGEDERIAQHHSTPATHRSGRIFGHQLVPVHK